MKGETMTDKAKAKLVACPNCKERMTYTGPVHGEDGVYMGYRCPACGTNALGARLANKLDKRPGYYESGTPRR